MSALLEFECAVPVGGYEVITIEERKMTPIGVANAIDRARGVITGIPEDDDTSTVMLKRRILQPRSKRTVRFDLFEINKITSRPAFLEFAQTPDTPDAIKSFADRYGALEPDVGTGEGWWQTGRDIDTWSAYIRAMKKTIELWNKSSTTGDFTKLIRTVQKDLGLGNFGPGVAVQLLLKEDRLSASARLCIRPESLAQALYSQLILAIDGKLNLRACVECREWFTLEAGRGRSDKEYCSDACRMRAYRKRKGSA
jgi:hypothetical protein